MTKETVSIDVSGIPELLRLAEEVGASGKPTILRRDRRELAAVVPLANFARGRGRKAKTKEDFEAFAAAAGAWKDLDTDRLVDEIYEDRRRSVRPPVEL